MKFTSAFAIAALASTANAYELLKDYAGNFKVGVAANTIYFNNNSYVNAMKAFNYMVAENGCKVGGIQYSRGNFNFNDCDNHLKKAKELGMEFRGHNLCWHADAPQWEQNLDANSLKNAIVEHITKVLTHYKGQIGAWDVVNEAIDDSSNGNGWKMRNSFLYQKVPNFIELAFETARKVDSNVKLFYNDYNTEGIWGKSESCYQFIKSMKSKGVPIDGVGIQYHVSVQNHPQDSKINDLIKRYCALGVEVHITELDVACTGACGAGNEEQQQANIFTTALKACLNNSCCKAYLVWGVDDNHSWLGSDKRGLLFNGNYQPKSQYTAVLNVLKQSGGGSPQQPTSTAPPAPAQTLTPTKDIGEGCYLIKNVKSAKYLQVAADGQNVEVGDKTSSTNQQWNVKNAQNGYVNLQNGNGKMLDIAYGEDANEINAQVYDANGMVAQEFKIVNSPTSGAYGIVTGCSSDSKSLDVYKASTDSGANVIQYTYNKAQNQIWNFESCSGSSSGGSSSSEKCDSQYPCCSTCIFYYEDNTGKWGVENNDWCKLKASCQTSTEECTGKNQGYKCCNSCDVVYTDESGKWGIMNDEWCGIKSSC